MNLEATVAQVDGQVTAKRRFRRYLEYRDSAIRWLGVIPKNWKVSRLRFLCDITTGGRDTQDAEEDGEYPFFVRSDNIERISTWSFDGEGVLTSGDGAGVGKVFHHYVGRMEIHQRVYLFHNFRHVIGRYFYYFLKENLYKVVLGGGAKSTVDSLRRPILADFSIALPSISEQELIVAFLDRETARIDELIAKKQALIDSLSSHRKSFVARTVLGNIDSHVKLKRSSVPWAAFLPEHWQERPAKLLFRQVESPPDDEDRIVTAFRDGQVTLRDNRRPDGFMIALQEVGYQKVRAGQLVIHSMDGFAGAIGVADSDGKCTPEYVVLEARRPDVIIDYFGHCLREMAVRGYIEVACKAVRERAPRLRYSTFKDFLLPFPPEDEQRAIAAGITTMQSKSAAKEDILQRSVDTLREYRAAIVSAAVTGQIDVRDYAREVPCQ